jgi:hypothetical protein
MTDNLAALARELMADRDRLTRYRIVLAGIDPAQLSPKNLEKYERARAGLDEMRWRIAELRRRLVEMRRRETSHQEVKSLVPRYTIRRVAAKARRRARRRAAACARKATADPPPKRKGPAADTRGPLENIINSSSGIANKPSGAAAQAPIREVRR